ncbi:MAG TPA: phage holin family protein [Patescibacteria group bacterium]|nr:phage holin family protein [Patescibacteria group bacterium]
MRVVTYLLINGFAVFIAAQVLSGVHVPNFLTAIIVAVVLGIVNTLLKPLLLILTFPITLVSFGLFAFVINAFLVLLVSHFVPGFTVDGFWWALIFSLVISVISSFLNSITHDN